MALHDRGGVALGLATAIALLGGCGPQGGTDVGNGRTVKLQLQAYEDPAFTSAQSITTASGVRIDAAWIAVDRLRFVPATDCEEATTEIDVEGPFVADLVGIGVLGGGPRFDVVSDTFCELRVGFHKLEPGTEPMGSPPALSDHSIVVEGVRTDGADFTVISDLNERIELESADEAGFTLPPGESPLFLAYEIASWVDALGLDALGAGPIIVDESTNADRLEPFEDAVKESARLFRDADEDGALEADEVAAGSELAD
jgi:hypothetical protein